MDGLGRINAETKLCRLTLDQTLETIFGSGYLFVFPYLVIYLIAAFFHFSPQLTAKLFLPLHFLILLTGLCWLYRRAKESSRSELFFYIGTFLLFLLPGVYLEFPSDAWEHLRRILAWETATEIRSLFFWTKSTYFTAWTLVGGLRGDNLRKALTLYGCFWQCVFAWKFIELSRELGFSKRWSLIQSAGVIALFGNNVFSFRYYALSTTIVAYVAYLDGLIQLLRWRKGKPLESWRWFFIIPIIAFNHFQEFLLLFISAVGLFGGGAVRRIRWSFRRGAIVVALWIMTAIFARVFLNSPASTIYRNGVEAAPRMFGLFTGYINHWGIFRLWNVHGHFFEAYALPGLIGSLFALFLARAWPELVDLTLAPFVLSLFPLFVLTLLAGTEAPNAYRIFYAFPTSIALITGLRHLLSKLFKNDSTCGVMVLALVLMAGIFPQWPWRGRLWFQFQRPPDQLTLQPQEETYQWFLANDPLKPGCFILSDNPTKFALVTFFGLELLDANRTDPMSMPRGYESPKWLDYGLSKYHVCRILVAIRDRVPPRLESSVGHYSGHWTSETTDIHWQVTRAFEESAAGLLSKGWTRQFVPPYYWSYRR